MNEDFEYTFHGQRKGERVLHSINSHPYVIYPPGFWSVLVLVLAIAVVLFWPRLYYISAVMIVAIGIYLFRAIYSFKESMLIITDQRIFAIQQKGFFNRKIIDVDLVNILDLQSNTAGFFRTVLKYGNLVIRTAGATEGGDIVITDIPSPYTVQQLIRRAQKR
jgi:uncharacterized membrane protein YdbT with pleckstrin-like domain